MHSRPVATTHRLGHRNGQHTHQRHRAWLRDNATVGGRGVVKCSGGQVTFEKKVLMPASPELKWIHLVTLKHVITSYKGAYEIQASPCNRGTQEWRTFGVGVSTKFSHMNCTLTPGMFLAFSLPGAARAVRQAVHYSTTLPCRTRVGSTSTPTTLRTPNLAATASVNSPQWHLHPTNSTHSDHHLLTLLLLTRYREGPSLGTTPDAGSPAWGPHHSGRRSCGNCSTCGTCSGPHWRCGRDRVCRQDCHLG